MLKRLMDQPTFKDYDLSSLQVITYGAAPMPLEVIKKAIVEFPGTRFINAFGQTETASTITMLPPDDHNISEDDPDFREEAEPPGVHRQAPAGRGGAYSR